MRHDENRGAAPGRRTDAATAALILILTLAAPSITGAAPDGRASADALESGWNLLTQCGDFRSADGRYAIRFEEHGTLTMSTDAGTPTPRSVAGEWTYGGAPARYAIAVKGAKGAFELFVPPESKVCILATPGLTQADLGHSWYAPHDDR